MKECAQCHLCYEDNVVSCHVDGSTLQYTLPGSLQIAEKYRLEKLIARASMGSIYRALQQDLQRNVAIKVLNPQLVSSNIARERFRREALAVASLKHPNIVTVFDFGSNPYGLFYIAMELLEGRTLADRLAEEKRLEVAEATRIALEVSDALAQAHAGGIIHRDLKPSNIFLSKEPAGETVKVIDFGLVKLKERADAFKSITAGALIGSLHYSAPEQYRSGEIDARADIYSLGVILYQMVTGRLPFDAPNKPQVIYQQLNAKPLPPHRIIFDIPPALEMAVLKAMEKEPLARFQTIAEFAEALRQAPKRGLRRTVGLFVSKPLKRASAEEARKELQQATQRALCFEHFVARKRELARLRLAFEQASEGRSVALLITGDPGIGKTELMAECVKELKMLEALCFTGQFTGGLSAPWSMTDLRAYLQQLLTSDPTRFDATFGPSAPGLREAIVGTSSPMHTGTFFQPSEETGAERSLEMLAQTYICLSEQQPVVLALDDLHAADESSLNFLMYLIGATATARIFFLFTARAQEIARPESMAAHWLDRMASQRQLQRLPLGPLTTADLRVLIEKVFEPVAISDEVIDKIWRVTEGNPFHMVNILRLMVEQGQIAWDGQQWQCSAVAEIKIPETVARLIEARFGFLSPQSREALELASILGEKFSFEALKRFTGLEEDELLRIIDDGLRYALLREARPPEGGSPQDDYYSFAQHVLYQVLYESRPADERRRRHLQAARIFAEMSAEQEPEQHPEQQIEAARQFLLADEFTEAFCHQVSAATSVWRTGEVALARQYLQNASAIAERIDLLSLLAQPGELDANRAALASHFCDYMMLSVDLKICSEPAQAEERLERALLLAERVGEPTLVARALVAAGHYQQNQGDYHRALSYFERALALYDETGNKKRYNVIVEQIAALRAKVRPHQPTVDIF